MPSKKTKSTITFNDVKAALIMDMQAVHAKELDKVKKAKTIIVLENLGLEFASAKTFKLFDKFDAQEEA